MSEDELGAIEELWRQEPKTGWPDLLVDVVPELAAEVRRLRGLIKAAECRWVDGLHEICPWCESTRAEAGHFADCPAFTPGGRVR